MNTVLWGPMFLFGILSLSDLIQPITGLYIRHVLSNFYIPAYLYGTYLFYEVAVYAETTEGWAMLAMWIIVSFNTWLRQLNNGVRAQYFLYPSDVEADRSLWPSLFYLLNWIEHTPKDEEYTY